jgi:hypothetical protein
VLGGSLRPGREARSVQPQTSEFVNSFPAPPTGTSK